jgi:hypothetical protein
MQIHTIVWNYNEMDVGDDLMINVRASKIGAAAVVDAPLQVPTPNSFSG